MARLGSTVLAVGPGQFRLAIGCSSIALFVVASIVAGRGFGSGFLGALRSVRQLAELQDWVRREKLEQGIDLTGWVEHAQIGQYLAAADVFAFPSIREFGGGAVLEAMAVGTVPIVVNYAGPAELVTLATGFLVELVTRQEIIERFRTVLGNLAEHPEQLAAKSALGIRRAIEQFTWDAKARQVLEVYHWLTSDGPKPDFPMPTPDPR